MYLATLNIIRVHRSSDAPGASSDLCYIKICDNEASYAVLYSVGERKKLAAENCEGSMKYILSHREDPVPTQIYGSQLKRGNPAVCGMAC